MPPLTITLPSEREIAVTRDFRAPPDLVFDCWTIPELIRRWYGPAVWEMIVCEFEPTPGVIPPPDARLPLAVPRRF